MTSFIKKVFIWVVGLIAAFVGGVFIANSETFISLQYDGRKNDEFSFTFESKGPSPVVIDDIHITPGRFSIRTTEDIGPVKFQALMDDGRMEYTGSLVSPATNGLTLYPGDKINRTFGMRSSHSFVAFDRSILRVKYKRKAVSPAMNSLLWLTDQAGLTHGSYQECFFMCGSSGAEMSCDYFTSELDEIHRTFCSGDFRSDRKCCDYPFQRKLP